MQKLKAWLKLKKVCAYCKPQRWMGGNPFSRQLTHGICEPCLAREMKELEKSRNRQILLTSSIQFARVERNAAL